MLAHLKNMTGGQVKNNCLQKLLIVVEVGMGISTKMWASNREIIPELRLDFKKRFSARPM